MRLMSLSVLFLAGVLCTVGCMHTRYSSIVSVGGGIGKVVTKNRYTLVGFKFSGQTQNADITQGNLQSQQFTNDDLKRYQPDVFSDDGLRIMLGGESPGYDMQNRLGWTTFTYLLTLTASPYFHSMGFGSKVIVDVLDNPDARASFEQYQRYDMAMSCLTPSALFCYIGDPSPPDGMATYSVDSSHESVLGLLGKFGKADYKVVHGVSAAAGAYAIAAVLKKMEDDGLIDAFRRGGRASHAVQPSATCDAFDLVDFNKDSGTGYRYSFSLRKRGGGNLSLRESREARKALRTMIRDDYSASFPDVAIGSLIVDFPEYILRDGMVRGRAAVLSLSVASLRYDSHSHTGTMRLRIGENQYEDARQYARRNIESLVRDKNVALDAQAIPPAATFYLLGESLKDDIMEITFRTE